MTDATYRVGFADWYGGNYLPEFYDGALDVESATNIPVPATTTVTGINASLAFASKISGTITGPDGITPLARIQVTAYRLNNTPPYYYWEQKGSARTLADGTYTVKLPEAGNYRIGFSDGNGTYLTKYHIGAVDVSSATDITVPAATTVTGINASLAEADRISGFVTGPNGTSPLAGILVTVYRQTASPPSVYWQPSYYGTTQIDGSYSIGGLPAGTYRIGYTSWNEIYRPEYYNGVYNVNSAIDIIVPAATAVTGISASLAPPVPPEIGEFRKVGTNSYEISFTGNAEQQYQLQESISLTDWVDIGLPFTCQAGANIRPVTSSQPNKFWRVRTVP